MFKSILVTSLLAISIGLVGCGKTEEQKAKDTAKAGNANIKQINSLALKLQEHGILLGTTANEATSLAVSKSSLSAKSDDDKKLILSMLKKYRSLAKETLEMGGEDNVELRGASHLQKEVKICNALIAELESAPAAQTEDAASDVEKTPSAPAATQLQAVNIA